MATDAQSLRTLSRMRSGSLPTVPSPLSRQGSFEDFGLRRGMALAERPHTRGSDCMDTSQTKLTAGRRPTVLSGR